MAKITINARKFKRFVNNFRQQLNRAIPRALNSSGEKTVETIVTRTQKGFSSSGSRFKPYTDSYKEYRKESGRSTKPDLNFSGRMLSNLGVKRVTNTKVKVFFSRKEEREKAEFNSKKRPFIGVRQAEMKNITEAFRRRLERDLQ